MIRMAIAAAGAHSAQGVCENESRASLTIRPQSGEGGCTPKPRKPSDAVRKMAYEKRSAAFDCQRGQHARQNLAEHDVERRFAAQFRRLDEAIGRGC